jgi:hypothetical protein
MLMKGSLHTDELLKAVLASPRCAPDAACRTSSASRCRPIPSRCWSPTRRSTSAHAAGEGRHRANAIDLARAWAWPAQGGPPVGGGDRDAAIPSTVDAAALCKMADRGQIAGGLLDGPLAFDNAISAEAARIKGIASPVAGQADILMVPDLEAATCWPSSWSTWPAPPARAWCWARACPSR